MKYLISDSLFKNCSSRNNGGAICFQDSGSFVHHRVCAFKSNTYNFLGHHSYIQLRGNSNDLNYHYESSYYKCCNLENSYTNILTYGTIQVKSINTSFCMADLNAGIFIRNSILITNLTFSTFFGTKSRIEIIGLFHGNYHLKFSNVLNNSQANITTYTLFIISAEVLIENCSFFGNNAYFEFGGILVSRIVINDIFCDNIRIGRNVILNNVNNTYYIHKLSHFSSYMCKAQYPGSTGNSMQLLHFRMRFRA